MYYQRRRSGFWPMILCLALGLGGELHVCVPSLGFVAMTDLTAYVIAIPILLKSWPRMGKFMRRSLLWGFAWAFAAALANLFHFINFRLLIKCITLASSSWAIMAAAYMLMKNFPKGFMWYLVGAGLGGWISLYYFRNGALEVFATKGNIGAAGLGTDLLFDKQVFPSIARGILFGCVLPFVIRWKKFPIFGVLTATLIGGFYLLIHGGSRSHFGMFCAAAGAGYMVAYGTRGFRRLAKSPFLMIVVSMVAFVVLFSAYKFLAKNDMMGAGEKEKFEGQFERGGNAFESRAGLGSAFRAALSSGGVGLGFYLRCHSVIANSLACEGFIGFLFWVYFCLQVLWWASHRMPYAGKNTTFIVLMIMTALWDVVGSPFGTRHKFFVLMTFIALCRDNQFYGLRDLFDEKMILKKGWYRLR